LNLNNTMTNTHSHKPISWQHQNLRQLIEHDENEFQISVKTLDKWLKEADAVLLSGGGKRIISFF